MIEAKECLRCKSNNVILTPNVHISIYGENEKDCGVIVQKNYSPTDALICKDCGHIELFIDWSKKEIK